MPTGTTTINFGAFPGTSDTSVTVTGQTDIVAGSFVEAWVRPEATADHTADEHLVETLKVVAGNISPGVGFTIYGLNTSQLNEPVDENQAVQRPTTGGIGTLIYGTWAVSYAWI